MQLPTPLDTAKKILFALLPPLYWLLIILAILYPDGTLSTAIFHWILFTLFLKIGIIIHETGHLQTGKLVGGSPKRMSIGTGHIIFKTRLLGVKPSSMMSFLVVTPSWLFTMTNQG